VHCWRGLPTCPLLHAAALGCCPGVGCRPWAVTLRPRVHQVHQVQPFGPLVPLVPLLGVPPGCP